MRSLADLAAAALPPYLRRVYFECGRDVGLVREAAETFVRVSKLEGRVGRRKVAELAACTYDGRLMRVDCRNNLEFWMEYDTETGDVRGRVPSDLSTARGAFVARRLRDGTLRFDHTGCPEFWLELRLLDCTIQPVDPSVRDWRARSETGF